MKIILAIICLKHCLNLPTLTSSLGESLSGHLEAAPFGQFRASNQKQTLLKISSTSIFAYSLYLYHLSILPVHTSFVYRNMMSTHFMSFHPQKSWLTEFYPD